MTPEEIVHQIDFTYIDDAITPHEALAILEAAVPGQRTRQPRSKPTACRRTRRRPAGSATTMPRSSVSFARRSPTDSPC